MISYKKRTTIYIILIGLILVGIFVYASSKQYIMSGEYISSEEKQQVLASHSISDSPLITDIVFNEQHLIYDATANTFYYFLVENDSASYNPEISLVGIYGNVNTDVDIAFIGPQITDDSIAAGQEIELILYDDNQASISTLICTNLPVMNITVSEDLVNELSLDETMGIYEDSPVSIYLYDNRADCDSADRAYTSDAKLRVRGGTTIGAAMKGYKIGLLEDKDKLTGDNNKVSLLGMREDDDWILYSGYSDHEKIRNVFSAKLWQQAASEDNEWDVANSYEYKYIELFFNGRYHGLYALGYPMDARQVGIDTSTSEEHMYKKKDWSPTEHAQELEYLDYGDGTGIYWLPGYSVMEGDASGYELLHNLYYQQEYSDDTTTIRQCVDMDNVLDWWLFMKLVDGIDNVYDTNIKNQIVTVKQSDNGVDGYKLLFAPWDLDQTWGNCFRGTAKEKHGITSYALTADHELALNCGTVYNLMQLKDANIVKELQGKYDLLRQSAWSDDNISQILDEYEADIFASGAMSRTIARWPDCNYIEGASDLSAFRTFVEARFDYMDQMVAALQ